MSVDGQKGVRADHLRISHVGSLLFTEDGQIRKLLAALLVVCTLLVSVGIVSMASAKGDSQVIPTISIESVEGDQTVTIRAHNYPANVDFTVRMGAMGTRAIDGTVVAMTNSGAGGTFDATYQIPEALKGARQIAIRLESDSGFYSYNWFYNNTTSGGTGDGGSAGGNPQPGYGGIPTFSVLSVEVDQSVTVRTDNFPENSDFVVTMGPMGTRGINGTVVETINSGTGGVFEATFPIPETLHGSRRISIRFQSTTGGFFAYNWFHNSSTGSGTGDGGSAGGDGNSGSQPGYSGIPTFGILSVARDQMATIGTTNFPENRDFVVMMGPMGTRGINGTVVETINSGMGGAFEATFSIPEALRGSHSLSIRLQSTTGGYTAYNWFYNNSTD